MKAYRVKNWPQIFESHESRKYKRLEWIRLPTVMTGKGFKRVAQHADNVKIFCAFILILEVAAVMPERGTLIDAAGLPLDSSDLALMTGYPEEVFGRCLSVLVEPKIGWLEHVDFADRCASEPVTETGDAGRVQEMPGESPGVPEDAGRERETPGDRRVLELRLRKDLRKFNSSIAKSASAKNGPAAGENEFMEAIGEAIGEKAMVNWGSKWRLRFRDDSDKALRILRDLVDKLKNGEIESNPGGYANKMWKVFV